MTFFAYLGFNVITFTTGDLRNPGHDLPRAMTFALGITSLIYVLIAVGVFGTLTTTQVIGYGETAIAEAARPALGDAGFTIMAIAALLSTAGCTNATLYASGNLTDQLAKAELFPQLFGERSCLGRHAGLLITAALVLIVANLVDLSAIASVGSAVSLVVFLLVGLAGWRRRADTNSNPVIVMLALGLTGSCSGSSRSTRSRPHPRRSPRSSSSGSSRSRSTPSSDAANTTAPHRSDPQRRRRHVVGEGLGRLDRGTR